MEESFVHKLPRVFGNSNVDNTWRLPSAKQQVLELERSYQSVLIAVLLGDHRLNLFKIRKRPRKTFVTQQGFHEIGPELSKEKKQEIWLAKSLTLV